MIVEIATSLPVSMAVDAFSGSLVIAASLCNSVLLYQFDAHIRMNVLDLLPLDQVFIFSFPNPSPSNVPPAKEEPKPIPNPLPNSDDQESFAMTRKMLTP